MSIVEIMQLGKGELYLKFGELLAYVVVCPLFPLKGVYWNEDATFLKGYFPQIVNKKEGIYDISQNRATDKHGISPANNPKTGLSS